MVCHVTSAMKSSSTKLHWKTITELKFQTVHLTGNRSVSYFSIVLFTILSWSISANWKPFFKFMLFGLFSDEFSLITYNINTTTSCRGVYYQNNLYFCPPPFFSKIIFFPPSTVKISSFPPFFHLLPLICAFSLINHRIFPPTYQKLIFLPNPGGGRGVKNIYPWLNVYFCDMRLNFVCLREIATSTLEF